MLGIHTQSMALWPRQEGSSVLDLMLQRISLPSLTTSLYARQSLQELKGCTYPEPELCPFSGYLDFQNSPSKWTSACFDFFPYLLQGTDFSICIKQPKAWRLPKGTCMRGIWYGSVGRYGHIAHSWDLSPCEIELGKWREEGLSCGLWSRLSQWLHFLDMKLQCIKEF